MGGRRNKSAKKWRSKVARVAKTVTLRNQETKCYEYTGANTTVGGSLGVIPLFSNGGSTSGVASPYQDLPLDNIDQGTNRNQRVGNVITLKGMHLKMGLQCDPNACLHTLVRVIIGWVDPNFTAISNANIYRNSAVAGNNVIQALLKSPTEPDTIFKKVLVDRVYDVRIGEQPFNALNTVPQLVERHIKIHIPFHNKKYQFISGTAGIGGEQEDLYVFVSAYAPSQNNTVQVANMFINNRIYYKDG